MKKVILALVLSVCGLFAKPPIMLYIELDKVLDSKDFMEIVGNEVSFSFGSGTENIFAGTEKTRVSIKKGRETNHFAKSISGKQYNFSEIESTCGYALLENLEKLKNKALEIGATKAVNIISYYTGSTQYDSKDKFQCIVSDSSVRVKLKADFAR